MRSAGLGESRFTGRRVVAGVAALAVLAILAGTLYGYARYRAIWDGIHRDAVTGLGRRPPKFNDAMNILVFGSDTRAGLTPRQQAELHVGKDGCGCSDTIMVVHISRGHHDVVVLNLPRDTMVPQYGCQPGPGYGGQLPDPAGTVQINQTLSRGGPSCLYKTVEQVTGIHIDHFIQLEFTGVVKVVDDVGGVSVCVPRSISDPESGLHLTAGQQHVNGVTFLEFWRARYSLADGTDLKRIQRDDLLLAQMLRGIIHSGLLSSPSRLLPVVTDAAHAIYATDAGLTQEVMFEIASSFRGLSSRNVQFVEALTQPYPPAPAQVELVPGDQQLFSAIAHDSALPTTRQTGPAVPPSDVRVTVLNGTSTRGLAASTAESLAGRGFRLAGTPGDAPPATATVVHYPSQAELAAADTLAAQVPGATVEQDPSVPAGTVQLVLGASFTSLAPQTEGSASPAAGSRPAGTPSPGTTGSGPSPTAPDLGSLSRSFGGITGNANCQTDARAFAP